MTTRSALARALSDRTRGFFGLAVVSVGFALFFAYPTLGVLRRGASLSLAQELFRTDRIQSVLWFAAWQAVASVSLAFAIALPLAVLCQRIEFRGRSFLLGLLSAPFTLPTVVVGSAFLALGSVAGPSDARRFGTALIVAAHVYYNVGFLTRAIGGALDDVPDNVRNAARTLGAGLWTTVRSIELSAVRNTVFRSLGLVFAFCFTSFGTVLILGGPRRSTLDVEIYRQALQFGRLDRAAVLAIGQLLVIGVVLALPSLAGFSQRSNVLIVRTTSRPRRREIQHRRERFGIALLTIALGAVVAAPLVLLIRRSLQQPDGGIGFRNYSALGSRTRGSGLLNAPAFSIAQSLVQSLFVSLLTMTVAVVLVAAVSRNRQPRTFARWLTSACIALPLSVSPAILGLGVLLSFTHSPINWRSSPFTVTALQTIVCLPFVLTILRGAVDALPRRADEAAATLGASSSARWRTVSLPLLRPALRRSIGTAYAVALGEFGAASLLARPSRETIPVAIVRLSSRPGPVLAGQSAALAVFLALLTGALAAWSQRQR